mmetsp:Transcript_37819/g.83265  ORF Transcript_37819/g.83265 Transcript_37819/m.83265 type:complete len:215 (-) Transcript_37819:561-1205(-)
MAHRPAVEGMGRHSSPPATLSRSRSGLSMAAERPEPSADTSMAQLPELARRPVARATGSRSTLAPRAASPASMVARPAAVAARRSAAAASPTARCPTPLQRARTPAQPPTARRAPRTAPPLAARADTALRPQSAGATAPRPTARPPTARPRPPPTARQSRAATYQTTGCRGRAPTPIATGISTNEASTSRVHRLPAKVERLPSLPTCALVAAAR